MSNIFRSIASYLGFYTSGAPAPVTTTADDGTLTTTLVASPTNFISPNVAFPVCFIGTVTLGSAATTSPAAAASLPASFTDVPLAGIDYNPPIASFTVSKIISVTIRAPPSPVDVNWYAGIWAPLAPRGRTYDSIRRRAPNVAWIWRSNVTVQPIVEHVVPWPVGKPVMDSLHAVLPGIHAPSLQFGFENQPHGTSVAAPAGAYTFTVLVEAEVAGYGMLGTI